MRTNIDGAAAPGRKRGRVLWMGAVVALLGQTMPACATPEPLTPDEICDDARRGIALRTQSCTQDIDLANQRYDLAKARLTCNPQLRVEKSAYDCSSVILATSCDDVAKHGDDMNAWTASPACQATFTPFVSTDPNAPTIHQACTDNGATCSCRILEGAKNEGQCVSPSAGPGQLPTCCASDGYPARGTCTCSLVSCVSTGSEGNRSCQCSPTPLGFGEPSLGCNRLTFPELQNGVCCLKLGSQNCYCSEATTCGSDETQVSTCEAAAFCTMAVGVERIQVGQCSP